MVAPCSLPPTARIRFLPKDKRPVLLKTMHDGIHAASIRKDDGSFCGIVQNNGWVLINHPRAGLVGLPLEGKTASWYAAWDEELVDIELYTDGHWQEPIYDWNKLHALCVTT